MLAVSQEAHTKNRIAQQFSRAAPRYDSVANIQGEIAQDAIDLLSKFAPKGMPTLLDIGSGTGRNSPELIKHCDNLLALDIAFGMLAFSKQKYAKQSCSTQQVTQLSPQHQPSLSWLQADAEQLPLQNAAVDGVFSSMVLQWCQNQTQVMQEIARVLKQGGKSVLAIMTEDSFHELNHSWQQLDKGKHVNDFAAVKVWQKAALNQGLEVECQVKQYVTWHDGIRPLLASIKSIGANVVIPNETSEALSLRKTPMNRTILQQLESLYRQTFSNSSDISNSSNNSIISNSSNNGQLPLTYQVCYLVCKKI